MSLARTIIAAGALVGVAAAAPTLAPPLLHNLLAAGEEGPQRALPAPPEPAARVTTGRLDLNRPATVPAPSSARRVALRADGRGHYTATATVNGRSVPVMVDTGATAVALSAESARRLGIRPPQSAFRMPIDTANGIAYAAPVKLGEVRIGNVSVRNVEAIVVPGDALSINLLGMTFLSRLSRFEVAGGQLVLTQ